MSGLSEIRQQLREYILTEFLPGESLANLKDDTPLRTSGVLDSIATLNLVTFVENSFGIEVEAHEAGIENFDRITDIALFIERKRATEGSKT
jgi:acyl carrier protein